MSNPNPSPMPKPKPNPNPNKAAIKGEGNAKLRDPVDGCTARSTPRLGFTLVRASKP